MRHTITVPHHYPSPDVLSFLFSLLLVFFFFFFNDSATPEIYPLSLQRRSSDLTIIDWALRERLSREQRRHLALLFLLVTRSEEHTSELQSPCNLVCRLLLEK